MIRLILLSATALLLLTIPGHAQQYDPALTVVRIDSHGASGAVIASAPGQTWILSCAHMFSHNTPQLSENPSLTKRPIKLKGPPQPNAPAGIFPAKLVFVSWKDDLSLIFLANGPFYANPVAPPGYVQPKKMWSCGYDEMTWPQTKRPADFAGLQGNKLLTVQPPWHGRSGGGIYDAAPGSHYLVGIVGGYEDHRPAWQHDQDPKHPSGPGFYANHSTILAFLKRHEEAASGKVSPQPYQPQPYSYGPKPSQPYCPT